MEEARRDKLRMPAEWEPQAFIQLTWPHADTDWCPMLDEITETYVQMANAITEQEPLLIVHPNPKEVKTLLTARLSKTQLNSITFFQCETNDTWARDHAFISLIGTEEQKTPYHLLDFRFNGWGDKFEATLDNAINAQIFSMLPFYGNQKEYESHLDFILEGGSIESDGEGTIFTTRCCLMAPHRNEGLWKQSAIPEYEQFLECELKRRLHAERIVWLDCVEMPGDDTDGHIDTMVRIAPNHTIIYNEGQGDRLTKQLKSLRTLAGRPYHLLELPLPSPIYDEDGEQLPATYANFLILNGAVLVPVYNQSANDSEAIRIIQSAFPDRKMVPIDSRPIIKQHGSIHCCTMQYPR